MRVWIASMFFYSFVFFVCEALRYIITVHLAKRISPTLRSLLLEFVGTLQICTPMFDVNLILSTYGLIGVFIEITLLELANCYFLRDAIAHPCPLVTSATRKRSLVRRAVTVFVTQLAAAYLSYFLAKIFWRLRLNRKHAELLISDHCEADLTVAITSGCLIEGFATFFSKAMENFASEQYSDSRAQALANCIFAGFITALGINFTGMYANPIVAWACTFNCEGITHIAHLIVYWLSPLVGWYFAEAVFGECECILEDDGDDRPKKIE
uniref:Aquaporin n=1 Tax=Ascaris lumbricoides TaxID=6252 RepID=A0A0M3I310_ASCLU